MFGSKGAHGSARLAEESHRAARAEDVEAFHEGGHANGVIDDINALTAGDFFDLFGEIVAGVDDDFVGSTGLRDGGLGIAARGAVDGGSEHLRHLHDQTSRASGGGVDQAFIAGFEGERRVRQIVRRHPLQHGRSGGREIDVIRQFDQNMSGYGGVFGVGAAAHRVGDTVAGFEAGHFGAHRFDNAGGLVAGGERQIGLVEAHAEVNVDEVDARGRDLNQRLFGSGNRHGDIDKPQFFRSAGLRYLYRLHCVFMVAKSPA